MRTQEKKYKNIKKRVAELRKFYSHLGIYIIVNIGLFLLNMAISSENLWFIWPLMGWGIAIILHALRVFTGTLGSNWEEKKINELMKKS